MRLIAAHLYRLAPIVLLIGIIGCGGDKSPTSPTPTSPAAPTRIIELSGDLAFGSVTVGQTKASTLTIRNTGTSALSFTGFSGSPTECTSVFFVNPTSGTVGAGSSAAISISFQPTAVKSYSCTLVVASDATAGTNSVSMSATGVSGSSGGSGGLATYFVWGGSGYNVYLGNFSCTFCKEFGSDSINNEFGTYGNPFSSSSIRNQFGTYGSQFSSFSPCNQFASTPPQLYNADRSVYYGALTINQFASGYIAQLHSWLTGDVCNH